MTNDEEPNNDTLEESDSLSDEEESLIGDIDIDDSELGLDSMNDVEEEELFVPEEDEDEEQKKEEWRQRRKDELKSNYSEFNWKEQWEDAREKVELATNGDESAYLDISTAPARVREYFSEREPRDNLVDVFIPLTLVFYGLLFLVFTFISDSTLLTQPDRIADLYLLDSVLLLLAIVGFVVARKRSDLTVETTGDVIRKRLRAITVGIHLIPTVVFGFIAYAFLTGQVEAIFAASDKFRELRVYLYGRIPKFLSDIGFWIWDVTPIGVTVQQVAIVMFLAGIIGTIPFVANILKVLLLAINVGADEELMDDEEEEEESPALQDVVENLEEVEAEESDMLIPDEDADESYDPRQDTAMSVDFSGKLSTYGDPDKLMRSNNDYRLEPYEGYIEIKRYWLKEPYSYAVILYNEDQGDHRYFAVEPQLNEVEKEFYREIRSRLTRKMLDTRVETQFEGEQLRQRKIELLEDATFEIAMEYNLDINDMSFQRLLYYIERDYIDYGKIDVLMNDTNVEDISCVGPNKPIWIYHAEHDNLITNIQFGKKELQRFIRELSQRSNESISTGSPMTDATLPDGSRAQLTLGEEVTDHGSTFTIRQFQDVPFTPVDLIRTDTFDARQMAYLWLGIENNKSLIFAGGTASGKTTSMNAVSLFIPPKSKVISLEDTREVELPHENWIPSKTREGMHDDDGIEIYDLLKAALRQRPEYLVVGEVRGEEGQDLFQAMSTGHTTYSTMHADTVEEALYRLQNDPINVPEKMIGVLDIICIQNRVYVDGETERRNKTITEILDSNPSGDDESHSVSDVFERDTFNDEFIDQTRESKVLADIQESRSWTDRQLEQELKDRERVLKYLEEGEGDHEFYDFRKVTRVIQKYMVDKQSILDAIEEERLAETELEDVTELDLDRIEQEGITDADNDALDVNRINETLQGADD